MNKEQAKQAIAVMQAWVDGEPIEFLAKGVGEEWTTPTERWGLAWDWNNFSYRVKPPEPRVHERWVITYGGASWTCLTLDDARNLADRLTNTLCYKGDLTLTHLKGEEQPWQE